MARTILGQCKHYSFKDHDPILDRLDRLYEIAGGGKPLPAIKIAEGSGVSASTINSWRDRRTKRPQFATVAAVVKSLGGSIAISYRGKMIGKSNVSS